MKVDMDTLKSSAFKTNLQSVDNSTDYVHKVAITDSYFNRNNIVAATSVLAPFFVGLRMKSHKKRSVDFHDTLKANNTMLNELQKHLDQGIEKWGNIDNNSDLKASNTTFRP